MKTIEQYLAEEPTFTRAVVGYLIDDRMVVLGLRKKVSNGLGTSLVAGIGGKLEPGEDDDAALRREVEEEIGVQITRFRNMGRVRFIFPHKPSWCQDVAIYLIDEWTGIPKETDVIRPESHEIDALPFDRMWDDNHYWLPKVLAGNRINAVYLIDEDNRVVEEMINPTE